MLVSEFLARSKRFFPMVAGVIVLYVAVLISMTGIESRHAGQSALPSTSATLAPPITTPTTTAVTHGLNNDTLPISTVSTLAILEAF